MQQVDGTRNAQALEQLEFKKISEEEDSSLRKFQRKGKMVELCY